MKNRILDYEFVDKYIILSVLFKYQSKLWNPLFKSHEEKIEKNNN